MRSPALPDPDRQRHPRVPEPFCYEGRLDGGRFAVTVELEHVARLRGARRLAVVATLALASAFGRWDPLATDHAPARALRRLALRLTLATTEGLGLSRWQDGAVGSLLADLLPAAGLPTRRGLRRSHLQRGPSGAPLVFTDDGRAPGAPLCLRTPRP